MNLPNAISLGRILIVPLSIWLILLDAMMPAFWLVVAAAISDGIDGLIAKKFDSVTVLGGFLDPIADKVLLISIFITLGVDQYIPSWLVILVVFRDLLLIGGAMLYHTITQALTMEPMVVSKINTASQLIFIILILGELAFSLSINALKEIGIIIVALTTFISGFLYVWKWGYRASEIEVKSKINTSNCFEDHK